MGNRATITIQGTYTTAATFYTHNDASPEQMLPVLAHVLAGSACTLGSAPNIVTALLTSRCVEVEDGKPADKNAPDYVRLALIDAYSDGDKPGKPMGDRDARYTIQPRKEHGDYGKAIGWELIVEESDEEGMPYTVNTYTNAAQVYEAAAEACTRRARFERALIASNEGFYFGARPEAWEADAERLAGEAIVAGLCVSA